MSISDISQNRKARKYSNRELLARVLWASVLPLFRLSPRHLWGFRNWLLRCFSANVGRGVRIYPSAQITMPWNISIEDRVTIGGHVQLYALGKITIGAGATVSQGAHLCAGTHNFRDAAFTLLKPPVSVGSGAWICTESFIGPGVTVGSECVVGARAVVTRDVDANMVVAGNPCRVVAQRWPDAQLTRTLDEET